MKKITFRFCMWTTYLYVLSKKDIDEYRKLDKAIDKLFEKDKITDSEKKRLSEMQERISDLNDLARHNLECECSNFPRYYNLSVEVANAKGKVEKTYAIGFEKSELQSKDAIIVHPKEVVPLPYSIEAGTYIAEEEKALVSRCIESPSFDISKLDVKEYIDDKYTKSKDNWNVLVSYDGVDLFEDLELEDSFASFSVVTIKPPKDKKSKPTKKKKP